MPAPVLAAGLPIAGSLIGKAIGGGGPQNAQPVLPKDLQPMRQQQIGLLNYMLGLGPDPRMQQSSGALGAPFAGNAAVDQLRRIMGGQGAGTGGTAPSINMQGVGLPPSTDLSGEFNLGAGMLPMPGQGGGQVPQQGGGVMTPQQRLESIFGPLGINPSTLQQQGVNALQQQLGQPSPEQRAAEVTLPQLQQNLAGNPQTQQATNALMGLQTGAGADVEGRLSQLGDRPITGFGGLDQVLQALAGGQGGAINFAPSGAGMAQLQGLASSNPGQGVVDALNPTFQRNLASANQQGGRFGSGNAVLRSRAVDDFNLTAANALQRGVDQQTAAAQALGQLGLGGDSLRLQGLLGGQQGQLDALRLATQGAQGLDQTALQALGQLGGFRLAGQGQQAQNLQAAGQLGLGQGQLGNQAAQVLAQILGQQGASDLNRATTAFNAGNVQTGMENVGQQRALDILLQQLGVAQGATLGGPVQTSPTGAEQGAALGGQAAQLALLAQYLGNRGNG